MDEITTKTQAKQTNKKDQHSIKPVLIAITDLKTGFLH